jgi:hypothetical protein
MLTKQIADPLKIRSTYVVSGFSRTVTSCN